jgi:cytochrome c-type biogenesis protein CcmH/NrfG
MLTRPHADQLRTIEHAERPWRYAARALEAMLRKDDPDDDERRRIEREIARAEHT